MGKLCVSPLTLDLYIHAATDYIHNSHSFTMPMTRAASFSGERFLLFHMQVTESLINEPGIDCSSPSAMKELMIRMQVYEVTSKLQKMLQKYKPRTDNPSACQWISCHVTPSPGSDDCVAKMAHCADTCN